MDSSCLDLALEGERLCKAGDYRTGVSHFESAIEVGTEDLQILSAIYSQLGNAYFHLQEYNKALEYHRHDLTLTRIIGDELGEAKASGNLGNTLKLLGRYDEALVCCQRHLDITRAIYDKVGQARALYNFGNVYHAKGKSICWSGAEPGESPEEARVALRKASQYYEANLCLVKELGNHAAQGRTYGNLGNTYYLLNNFEAAVKAHQKRLLIAKEFGDRSAERRAHCNLGNAYIFLGQFDVAADHYKRTLQLARVLKDRAVEAQACYSLGNTYTLMQDYDRAIDYHLKHLVIAKELGDRVGEGRAYWSLGNAHTALGNHKEAMHFAEKHLEIAKETGDKSGEGIAKTNLSDLRLVVSLNCTSNTQKVFVNSFAVPESQQGYLNLSGVKSSLRRRGSAENKRLDQSVDKNPNQDLLTNPDKEGDFFPERSKNDTVMVPGKLFHQLKSKKQKNIKPSSKDLEENLTSEEDSPVSPKDKEGDLFTQPSKNDTVMVSSKLFHQLKSKKQKNIKPSSKNLEENLTSEEDSPVSPKPKRPDTLGEDSFFDLISRFQGNRIDDQRCTLDGQNHPPAHPSPSSNLPVAEDKCISEQKTPSQDPGHFLELLASCQARRLDDQRVIISHFPGSQHNTSSPPCSPSTSTTDQAPSAAPTPSADTNVTPSPCSRLEAGAEQPEGDDVFFDMLVKCQGSRLNDQRCTAPTSAAKGQTIPNEDFFSLILRSQSNRIEEQRVPPPPSIAQSKPG